MKKIIPKNPEWCSHCISPLTYGLSKTPCTNHLYGSYDGDDAYEPTEFVLNVVGQCYTAYYSDKSIYKCFGYDPRYGFWMVDINNPENKRNISERAIGRTFHKVYKMEKR